MIGTFLSGAVAASFLALGAGAFAAPRALAENYGIPLTDDAALAYVRGLGARDAVLGFIIIALLVRREHSALATTVGFSALVGASDFALVVAARRGDAPSSLAIHGIGTLGLLAVSGLVRSGL